MTGFEMLMAATCALGVVGAWWWAVTRPAFSRWLEAWAERHSRETQKAIITAYADGYQDGQENERTRGSVSK